MGIEAVPLKGSQIGAEVKGVDIDNLDGECKRQLHKLFLEYGVLVIRNTPVNPAQHIDLTRSFGNTELHPVKNLRLDDYPELILLESGDDVNEKDGKMPDDIVGKIPWHADLTYTTMLSRGAVLTAKVIPPEGGETGFVDTVAVYNDLPDSIKTIIDKLEIVHQFDHADSVKEARIREASNPTLKPMPIFPDIAHPLVIRHPESGYKALNISPMFTREIIGLDAAEGHSLLMELKKIATSSKYSYVHHWKQNDLVMWDNWRTLHSAFGHKRKYRREVMRTTIEATVTFGREINGQKSVATF